MISRLIGSDIPNIGDSSGPVTINLQNTWFQLIASTARKSSRIIISIIPIINGGDNIGITLGIGGAGVEANLFGTHKFPFYVSAAPHHLEFAIDIPPASRIAVKNDYSGAATYQTIVAVTLMGRA